MTDAREKGYIAGSQAAWNRILREALRNLSTFEEFRTPRIERVAELMTWKVDVEAEIWRLCELLELEPSKKLYLADVIDKHVIPAVEDYMRDAGAEPRGKA